MNKLIPFNATVRDGFGHSHLLCIAYLLNQRAHACFNTMITEGYGVQAYDLRGQNALAPTLCFS